MPIFANFANLLWSIVWAVSKMFAGVRLRRLREERGLTQVSLARTLGLSTSYVNQLENDQRPITVSVLLKLTERFDLPAHYFSPDSDARLVADLSEILTEQFGDVAAVAARIDELVARMPEIGRGLVALHRRLHEATDELETYRSHATAETPLPPTRPMPFEEVRDFFYDRKNYIGDLDLAAEQMFVDNGMHIGGLDIQLSALMREFGVTVVVDDGLTGATKRSFDPDAKVLRIAHWLLPGQRAFQIATQLALLSQSEKISAILANADQLSQESTAVARIGLANYFAGAFLLPYRQFHRAAEELRYDVDLLARRFEVGFETVCHRLSTLQRPQQRGVPFIFVRTDRAGNISKRQSATAFHFSRVGGSCPLWVVHDAFAQPGRIVTQVAEMPDGRSYFWIAKTTAPEGSGYLGPQKSFAIGLGCDLAHAHKLVYPKGIALDDPTTAVPIGAGCKICTREACSQRAFPYLGRPVLVDPDTSSGLPYSPAIPSA